MNEEEIRQILAASRPHGQDADDPLVAQATEEAKRHPQIAAWVAEEQEFDRRFASALGDSPLPEGLKTKLLASEEVGQRFHLRRSQRLPWAIAAIAVFIVIFSSWSGLFQPSASLADFRAEMLSFVRLTPALELETPELERIRSWLTREGAPLPAVVPSGLAKLDPTGCRVLSFRGHKVTLICFRRSEARLVHLMVIEREGLGRVGREPRLAQEGDWATALWSDGDHVYLLTTKGEPALLKHYLAAR